MASDRALLDACHTGSVVELAGETKRHMIKGLGFRKETCHVIREVVKFIGEQALLLRTQALAHLLQQTPPQVSSCRRGRAGS